jgi:hypothetical protein
MEGTARTAIASGAAFGSRLLLQVFLVVLERCGPGSHTVGDASQRTKAAHSRGPVRGHGHGRPQAEFVHVIAIERGGNIVLGDSDGYACLNAACVALLARIKQ